MSLYRKGGKRALDVVAAAAAGLVLSPVLAAAALAVRLDSPGPVLFRQERLGKDGEVFTVTKFRTMTDRPREAHAERFAGDPDITRVGRWLRRTKIDELPQVLDVLKGHMSLVGPRPGLPSQIEELDAVGRERLRVRPGLTGLAQVNGNIHLSWPERWRYDAAYVRDHSFWLDTRIVARTLAVLVLGEERFLRRPIADVSDSPSSAGPPPPATDGSPPR